MRESFKWLLVAAWLLVSSVSANETSEPLFIDVRTWAEHQFDGIDGDLHIHYSDIIDEIEPLAQSKDQRIYVYCTRGIRAERARQSLIGQGYTNVVNLGGIEEVKQLDRAQLAQQVEE